MQQYSSFMPTFMGKITLETRGEGDIKDITSQVQRITHESGIRNGLVCIFNSGSTGAITTLEYEPGLLNDLPKSFERLAPRGDEYDHEKRWHDGNGHSHVRASILGPSLTVPIQNRNLQLGTWQQIVFIELDVRQRNRNILVRIVGEN